MEDFDSMKLSEERKVEEEYSLSNDNLYYNESGENYINQVHGDILSVVWKYLDVKSLVRTSVVNKEW